MTFGTLYGSTSESNGLYGIGDPTAGTYFQWMIFRDSATAPATPTGGSWSFSTNSGTAPSSWLSAPPASVTNKIWVSLATVDSRNSAALTWSTPGIFVGNYFDYLQLPQTTGTTAVGKLQWDTTWGGPQIGMAGGNVNLQIGQETLIYVYNNTGSQLNDGQIVYVTGSQGQRLTVGLAKADSELKSSSVIGMVTEPIAIGSSGFVTTQGVVNGISTTGIDDGTILYLSSSTAGAWTSIKTQAPNHLVVIGYVVKGNSGNGSVYISTQSGYELDELHDVKITTPANSDFLQYDSSLAVWKNVANPVVKPAASVTPANNGDMQFQLTNNTTLVVKVKGSDGVVRSATLTLV